MSEKQKVIAQQLQNAQLHAFGGLLLSPLLGACLLDYIRASLARPANGLITNFNITVFVLAAELRPLKIAYEYLNGRAEYLQEQLVDVVPSRYQELVNKVEALEARLSQGTLPEQHIDSHRGVSTPNALSKEGTDLNQIKYALRKFEKHEAQLRLEYEAKFYSLERQFADLGARSRPVTSNTQVLYRISQAVILLPARLSWQIISLPARTIRWLSDKLRPKHLKMAYADS